MEDIPLQEWFTASIEWLTTHVLVWSTLFQFAGSIALFAIAYIASKPLAARFEKTTFIRAEYHRLKHTANLLILPVLWCILQWLAVLFSAELGGDIYLTRIIASLLTAWIVIRFTASFVENPALAKAISITAWTIAALNIVHLLDPTLNALDKLAITVGELHVSVLSLIKGLLSIGLLLWIATASSRILERKIRSYAGLEPSLKVLFSKLLKISFITLAIFFGLSSMGLDLSVFAVFGGAIGVGIGFGLQKVVSNLICGVILLLDRSIKPGDVIAINNGQTFGWVNRLSARCVSVRTRDGQEHLIPNEDFITQKVENWSYSDTHVRLKIGVSVSYDTDVPGALKLLEEATDGIERVMQNPAPAARLIKFDDSAIQLELRVWITDPEQGVTNVRSAVMLRIWELFREHNIAIPFPQRDIHIKSNASSEPLPT